MADDDGRLLLASIIGFGGGIYIFLKGFRTYRKYRVVADTPAVRIRSAPMGFVQIRGEARGEQTLLSPVTHTPCYLFQVVVEQWHSDSEGGGYWKHVATDIQTVKFDLQDASGNVLIDPTNAELDLPCSPARQVRGETPTTSVPQRGATPSAGTPAVDSELLQYIEQARLRHVTQMVGKGVGLLAHAAGSAGSSPGSSRAPRASILSALTNPTGNMAEAFAGQMMRTMLARHDPAGETTRAALEVWKYAPGSPEFTAALTRSGQVYARIMASSTQAPALAAVEAQIRQNPEMAMTMAASVAGAAPPQVDPELEKARQVAQAYAGEHMSGLITRNTSAATGHYRLTESCVRPGQMYDVAGTCAENPNPRDQFDRNIIEKGSNEPTFLISCKAAKEVESWLWKRALWMVLGGAALAVLCLAILLGKLGLL